MHKKEKVLHLSSVSWMNSTIYKENCDWKGKNLRQKHSEHIWSNIDLKKQKQVKLLSSFLGNLNWIFWITTYALQSYKMSI